MQMKRKEDLVERMGKQICSAVQWEEDVRVARSLGMAPLVSSIDKAIQVV